MAAGVCQPSFPRYTQHSGFLQQEQDCVQESSHHGSNPEHHIHFRVLKHWPGGPLLTGSTLGLTSTPKETEPAGGLWVTGGAGPDSTARALGFDAELGSY